MTNSAVLKGNAGRDPELRTTTSGTKVATYSIGVYRANPKDKDNPLTDWFNIIAWGDQADIVMANVKKGTRVLLCGKFQTRSYDDKNGNKVNITEFVQDDIGIIPKKGKEDTGSVHGDELPF